MTLEFWAEFLERSVAGIDFCECGFGNKSCDYGHWTQLFYSEITGWSQVLYWCENPQSDIEIVKIAYYDSALSALQDNSIFPAGSKVWYH